MCSYVSMCHTTDEQYSVLECISMDSFLPAQFVYVAQAFAPPPDQSLDTLHKVCVVILYLCTGYNYSPSVNIILEMNLTDSCF